MEKLLSASEIAALRLPGMPTTKAAVTVMAKREGWYFEERTGKGGVRRLYRLPARLSRSASHAPGDDPADAVAGAITSRGRADPKLLAVALREFDQFADSRNLMIAPERKAAIIALLYDYLAKGAHDADLETFFNAVAS